MSQDDNLKKKKRKEKYSVLCSISVLLCLICSGWNLKPFPPQEMGNAAQVWMSMEVTFAGIPVSFAYRERSCWWSSEQFLLLQHLPPDMGSFQGTSKEAQLQPSVSANALQKLKTKRRVAGALCYFNALEQLEQIWWHSVFHSLVYLSKVELFLLCLEIMLPFSSSLLFLLNGIALFQQCEVHSKESHARLKGGFCCLILTFWSYS